jgi:hypothetical protein
MKIRIKKKQPKTGTRGRPPVYSHKRKRIQLYLGAGLIDLIQEHATDRGQDANAICCEIVALTLTGDDPLMSAGGSVPTSGVIAALSEKKKFALVDDVNQLGEIARAAEFVGVSSSAWFSLAALTYLYGN